MPQDMKLWEARALFDVAAHMRHTAAKDKPRGRSKTVDALNNWSGDLEKRGEELLAEAGPQARRFEVVS